MTGAFALGGRLMRFARRPCHTQDTLPPQPVRHTSHALSFVCFFDPKEDRGPCSPRIPLGGTASQGSTEEAKNILENKHKAHPKAPSGKSKGWKKECRGWRLGDGHAGEATTYSLKIKAEQTCEAVL